MIIINIFYFVLFVDFNSHIIIGIIIIISNSIHFYFNSNIVTARGILNVLFDRYNWFISFTAFTNLKIINRPASCTGNPCNQLYSEIIGVNREYNWLQLREELHVKSIPQPSKPSVSNNNNYVIWEHH
jgi:hypothetical protein